MSVVGYTQFNKCKYEKNFYAKLLLACRTGALKIGSSITFLFESYFLNLDVILQSCKMLENKRNHTSFSILTWNSWWKIISCLYLGIRKKQAEFRYDKKSSKATNSLLNTSGFINSQCCHRNPTKLLFS